MSSSTRIAWIGLGNMGKGMTKNLVEKGDFTKPLILYNRTTSVAEKHASQIGNSEVVTSIEDAVARADIVFTCLGDDASASDNISLAAQSSHAKGKLFVDCTTVHPDTTAKISKAVEAQGAYFVACPVFGAPAMANAGQLICVIAGPKSQTARILPYCKGVMGRVNIDFSDQPPSKATMMKIIGNTFVLSMVSTLAEGHVLAEKSGLGQQNLHEFIEIFYGGPWAAYSKRMMEGDYYNREYPLFAVELARKDARHALSLAEAANTRMKISELAAGWLETVQKEKGETGDLAGIYGAKRLESGLKYENQN